jgi:hypothetical protein
MYAGEREAEPPSTEEIMRIGQLLPVSNLVEAWQLTWRRAIQRSVLSHLMFSGGELRGTLTDTTAHGLDETFRALGRLSPNPRTIYAEVTDIIRSHHTGPSLTDYLKRREWDDFQYWFEAALKQVRPIYLYIDLVDDNFSNAPMYWVPCQMGLFLEVWRLLATEAGRRLHVVICLRDIVWSRLMRTEHASRYRTSPHVRVLEWDYPALDYLLAEKIRRLSSDYVLATSTEGIARWLGRTAIHNQARDIDESCEDYMLRHTRLIPRDVIELGNELSKHIVQLRSHGQTEMPDEILRRVVGAVARRWADEQIRIAANQIASDEVPEHGAPQGYAGFYVGSAQYADERARCLLKLLGDLQTDRFDRDAVERLAEAGRARLGGHEHLLDVLWQNGLLGYDSTEENSSHCNFYGAGEEDSFHLPLDKRSYVVHPSLPHLIPLRHVGDVPVRGYRKLSWVHG